jgi:hypothetical protein
MIYCFDIDNTICTTIGNIYFESLPIKDRIALVNRLYDDGHTIKLFTARGSTSGMDWRDFTEAQLKKWGVKYHELIVGKPHADIYIDDKAMNINDFFDAEHKNYAGFE